MKVKYALHKHTKMHNIIFRLGVALGWDFDDHDHDDDNMLWDGGIQRKWMLLMIMTLMMMIVIVQHHVVDENNVVYI